MTVISILTTPLQDDDLTLELASFQPHPVHKVPTYYFRMVHRDAHEELGHINLRVASTPHIQLCDWH